VLKVPANTITHEKEIKGTQVKKKERTVQASSLKKTLTHHWNVLIT